MPPDACVAGACVDTAERCRVHELIHVGPLLDTERNWGDEQCRGGRGTGIDPEVWSLWLRYGLACEKGGAGRAGSTCVDICDYSPFPCSERAVCVPDSLFNPGDRSALERVVGNRLTSVFPTYFPTYPRGSLLTARSHVVLGGMGSLEFFEDLQETLIKANLTARLGDGIAVTPCGDGFDPASIDPMIVLQISCDYEASYAAMLRSIVDRAAAAVCDSTTNVPAPAR